jgi:hypothetical protein
MILMSAILNRARIISITSRNYLISFIMIFISTTNVVEFVVFRSMFISANVREINCVRCVKRLINYLNYSCVKRADMSKCETCRRQNHVCISISEID